MCLAAVERQFHQASTITYVTAVLHDQTFVGTGRLVRI